MPRISKPAPIVKCRALGSVLVSLGLLGSTGCARAEISGTYMASGRNSVIMLQIVETPDKHLTGQVTGLFVQPDGKIQNVNEAVNGVADGSSLTVETKPIGALTIGPQLSGAVNWKGEIELTGPVRNGQVTTLVFVRGSAAQFQTVAAEVRSTSDAIVKSRAMQKNAKQFLSGVKQLTVSMQRFGSEADKTLHDAPSAEQRYRNITSKMKVNLDREHSLVGNSNAFVARLQIATNMLQGPIAADQMHFRVQSLEGDFQNKIVPMAKQTSEAMAGCKMVTTGKYDGPMKPEIASACQTLANADPEFQQKYKATADALARLETVYQQERKVQQSYSDEAQKIE